MQDAKKIEHMVGQRIMAGFQGTELNAELRFLIDTLQVGGIILFSRNITGRGQLKNLCKSAAQYAKSFNLPPLFIAVDQEGGTVARLKAPDFTEYKGAPFIKTIADALAFTRGVASDLNDVGINMNMAPVMDVFPEGFDSVMSKRVFSTDPHLVARIGSAIINGFQRAGIMAVAKHFPGIGRTALDSHIERPDLDASLENLEAFDLIPFSAAVTAGVSGIMLSHIRYTGIDPEWPASLSPEIACHLLRNKMGYNGLVLSDDLEMGAIGNHYGTAAIAEQLLAAEVDIALVCKTKTTIEEIFASMCRQIHDKMALQKTAVRSSERINALKSKLMAS